MSTRGCARQTFTEYCWIYCSSNPPEYSRAKRARKEAALRLLLWPTWIYAPKAESSLCFALREFTHTHSHAHIRTLRTEPVHHFENAVQLPVATRTHAQPNRKLTTSLTSPPSASSATAIRQQRPVCIAWWFHFAGRPRGFIRVLCVARERPPNRRRRRRSRRRRCRRRVVVVEERLCRVISHHRCVRAFYPAPTNTLKRVATCRKKQVNTTSPRPIGPFR